jgi:thimet oligopeptidase
LTRIWTKNSGAPFGFEVNWGFRGGIMKLFFLPLLFALFACTHSQVTADFHPRKSIIRSDYKVGEIEALCQTALQDIRSNLNALVEALVTQKAPLDFTHTYLTLDLMLYDFNDIVEPLSFMAYVHSQKNIRDEAIQCEEKTSQFFVELYTHKDLYDLIRKIKSENPAEKRLIQKVKTNFERNGMELNAEKLEQFKKLKTELATLEAQFSKNLNEDVTQLALTAEQLKGAPESFLSRLKKDSEGRYLVTTKRTDYNQVMDNVSVAETRKLMHQKYNQRGGRENILLLERALEIRQQLAALMKFKSWADYQTRDRMAKNADTVWQFYSNLRSALVKKNRSDLKILLEAKKKDLPQATQIEPWDVNYYYQMIQKSQFSLDQEQIREYFPKDFVMEQMFRVYSTLFGVTFEDVQDADVWNPEVKLYVVREKNDPRPIAYFYTDFVPREGKYGHAAAFTLIKGRKLPSSEYSQPVSAIVANFTPPSGSKPALLTHDEVETLFHEFGHIIHQILTRAPYGILSGTNVSKDFVEAPSQMLEGWVWDKDILMQISGHYSDTNKKLPLDIIDRMIGAKNFNQGYFYARQMYLGIMDFTLHTQSGKLNAVQINQSLYKSILGMTPVEGDIFPSSFGHIMGAYDAGYYGYLWSQVFAADMLSEFEKNGLLNSHLGKHYRKTILEQGDMEDALTLVEKFLGRKPDTKAFYKSLGLKN